ncbi:protein translocase subunit SecA-like [Culex pipiens pallens]|uniref:protein translocase subunit SecA-like n=1 Tax=Culex pipiens pallens TaxID=42434 RepID=UPI0022A9FD1B|nr:protein translocase subunit SecA-like [Culex pipiens pallens]
MPSKEYLDVFLQKGTIKVVENKWNDNEHQCYCVKDADKFKKCFNVLFENEDLPRNFIVETIKKLLGCIINLETKERWYNSTALTESEQLNATRLLITSVRSSLLYLKEQPDSINFEQFLEESTKPFTTVCDESSSFEDFEKRVLLIKESFWYIRNLNAINIDTALKLYKENNKSDYSEENLRLCYLQYTKQFEQFMGANSELSLQKRIQRVVEDTSQIVERSLTSQWTAEFKHQKLPLILAGLGAVWAMHVSKDVASTGQYLKPHCIQILCVFRLLSADRNDQGVRKHLAQVLTGQGKSLVLAMVASILVFCGHSVQVMCYSNYLASRDKKDFEDFYDFFGIREKISYQTFEKAASERVKKIAGNARTYLSKCIGLPEQSSYSGVLRPNPIMLIDEVDVFFDKRLHGETYNLGFFPKIPGLDKIHLKIWELFNENCSNVPQAINDYINNESDSEVAEFNKIMNKPGQYSLYTNAGDKNNVTNQSLFSSHIDKMIATAEKVYAMKSNDSFLCKFRLNDAGNITVKDSFGNYTENTIYGYYNVFIYLKLKETDFEKGTYNYGYLNLSLGSTSYAKIPEAFPLILGVSGTLTTLSNYEKKIVNNYYNIQEMSVMSSFFGASNLKFNQATDFNCLNSVTSWMHAIFARINTIINAGRSVLVIFDTDTSINAFKLQFVAQLDRLNVLTVNTRPSDKERFISDAGVSKTITLATRGMGRGVDYKSSVAVEMNGGVHVIQSFFSEDIKEETQIKGRTARKDNRGSYELIVCIEDLKNQNLVKSFESSSTVTYQRLHESRKREMTKKDATRDEQLSKANRLHDTTVSFYKYK